MKVLSLLQFHRLSNSKRFDEAKKMPSNFSLQAKQAIGTLEIFLCSGQCTWIDTAENKNLVFQIDCQSPSRHDDQWRYPSKGFGHLHLSWSQH